MNQQQIVVTLLPDTTHTVLGNENSIEYKEFEIENCTAFKQVN